MSRKKNHQEWRHDVESDREKTHSPRFKKKLIKLNLKKKEANTELYSSSKRGHVYTKITKLCDGNLK